MKQDRDFEELVRRHQRAVSAFALSLCRDRHMAEDAVQETFLRAWQHLDSFRGDGSFEGWLIMICRRCCLDLISRGRGASDAWPIAELASPPEDTYEILSLVGELPPHLAEVLVLCGWMGYSYDDAATIIGVPVGTIRSRLHRARAALRDELGAAERWGS